MANRYKRAEEYSVRNLAVQSATWASSAQSKIGHFIVTAHRTLLIFGLAAMTLLAVMFFKPHLADRFISLSPFAENAQEDSSDVALDDDTPSPVAVQAAEPAAPAMQNAALKTTLVASNTTVNDLSAKMQAMNTDPHVAPVTDSQQKRVITWLSKRYRLATDAANMLVSHTYKTAQEIKLDPLLVLAVMAIESGFNPYAESPMGAQGLMQVMSKIHHDKFRNVGGTKSPLNPLANIKVGALILKDYVSRGGSVEAGLKSYVGAAAFESDSGYGSRVLAEYRRLKDVAGGKNVPVFSTPAASASLAPKRQLEPALPKAEIQDEAALEPENQQVPSRKEHVAVL